MIRLREKTRVSHACLFFAVVIGASGCTAFTPEPPKDLPPSGLPERTVSWEHRGTVWADGAEPSLTFPDGVAFKIESGRAEIKDGKKIHLTTLGGPADEDHPWAADATASDNIWAAGYKSVCRWDGRSWKTMTTLDNIWDVTTADPQNAWTLSHGEHRTVLRWKNGVWDDLRADTELIDIDSEAPESLWAISEKKVLHHDGTHWTDHTPKTDALFTNIAVAADGSVWVGTDRPYVLILTDGIWSRSKMPIPTKVKDEASGLEGDPDWTIWGITTHDDTVEVTAYWYDDLDGSDGIYDWHVYRTSVNTKSPKP